MHETLSQSFYTDEGESKRSIVNKNLLQNYSADEDKLSYTEEDKSKCTIIEQKDKENEVTYDVPNYFNVFNLFECGRNILDRLDVSYERAYMATQKEKYFSEMLDYLNNYNEQHGDQFSSEKLQDAVIRVIEEEEEDTKKCQ